jgi:hypothetical protein
MITDSGGFQVLLSFLSGFSGVSEAAEKEEL